MPDGDGEYRIGSAYVEVHLRDQTQADEQAIRSKVEGEAPISLQTALNDPSNTQAVKDRVKASGPAELPVEAANPVDDAWRQQIRASLKSTTLESLKIPLDADSEEFRLNLSEVIKEVEKGLSAEIPVDLDKAVEFKQEVQLLAAMASEEAKVRIPVEVDNDTAQKALRELSSSVDSSAKDSSNSFLGMFRTTTLGWTALGTLVAGPLVAGGLALVAGGFTAIGIAAEHSSPQVQQSFNTMKTEGVDVLKNGFTSLTPVIVSSLGTMTDGIRGLAPEVQTISGEMGPFLTTLSGSLVKAAQTDLPAFSTALGNATPLAKALGTGIEEVATGVAGFVTRIDFSQASSGLQALLSDVSRLLPVAAGLVNAIMPFSNALLTSVIPAATNLANVFISGLAPAIHLIGAAITDLGPLLNFMSGPTASVLVGVVAFKALQAATNGLLPIFNTVSTGVSTFANKALDMAGATDKSVGSFTLLTNAGKQQAVQAAAAALATAQQTAAQAQLSLTTVEAAAASEASAVTEEQLTAARAAATAATEAEAEATTTLAAASETSSFAFGPVGIGLAAVAGAMALFMGNTDKATPTVQNFTQQLNQLSQAAPDAAAGILASNPKFADFIKQTNSAGISVSDLTSALNGNGDAQQKVIAQMQGSIDAFGKQSVTVEGTTSNLTKSIKDWASADPKFDSTFTPQVQAAIKQFRALQGTLGDLKGQFGDTNDAQKSAAQVVQLTSEQQGAASGVAKQFGLSVDVVTGAFQKLPGAGAAGAEGVAQVTSAFSDQEVKLLNAEQSTADYFKNLQKNADQASQALASAQHSYSQSVTAVADAEHSAAQAAQAVVTAREGVAAATRSVTDAEHSYVDTQHSVAQAQQGVIDAEAGVITAENNLAKAQDSERQAQVALTDARKAAAEQLKSLHLQLNDQIVSEQQAQIRLFDQTRTSAAAGVTTDNAQSILAAPLTAQNEALKQSALDLVSAQNSLADTMNTGVNLREQVTAADKAGVDGSQQVISAQQALKSAQDQVTSSEQALVKSHQQVQQAVFALSDANYALGRAQQAIVDAQAGVVRAEQGVTDAVYAEQKSRQSVTDAIFNQKQSLAALKQAQDAARAANDLNTHSLDLATQAGRNNWGQLQQLFNSYPAWMTEQQKYNQMVDDTAASFNGSKKAAFDFLQQQGKIPKDYRFSTTGVAQMDLTPLQQYLGNKGIDVLVNGEHANFAEGGHVTGPGGPKDDLIDAKLSNNEFVQPADAVAHYGVDYMEALRQKKLPKFASGGLVTGNFVGDSMGSAYITAVNVAAMMGAPHPPQMPQYVPPTYSGGGGGAIPSGQHLALIDAALAADGVPRSEWARWEAGMNTLIQRESGWNAGAVNNWDSNAKAGHPSGGLTQTIGPTFESNRNRSLPDNMFDPEANIAASINYILNRYGDISNVQQANPNLPPKGYALGDIVGTDGSSLLPTMPRVAQIVPPRSPRMLGDSPTVDESYIPNDPTDPRAQQILAVTNRRMGQGGSTINNNVTINTTETDPDRLAAVVSSRLGWAMRGA
ncbi:transglycosylase SLT domain-containing protein [Amycolatopsis sp. NPDC051373]|uniref:transglycosylase SLT domain-containing protein n=1 Tax=Amycolatopsis sp. NPDC051373 TaxID=3155801 RepID=UPI00344B3CD6